jgi:hypothetical protein
MSGITKAALTRRSRLLNRRSRLLTLALAVLALAWTVTPTGRTPPLYDGLGFPDQPYRYVTVPAGYRHTPAPGTAAQDIPVRAGASNTFDAVSAELGPQVEVFLNQESLRAPAGSTVAHLRATPVAASAQPSDGEVWGNVYRLSAVTNIGPARIAAGGRLDSIRLRAPTGPPPVARIEFRDAAGWHRLATSKIGNDIYSAPLGGVGDYAVIAPKGQARVPQQTTSAPASGASASPAAGDASTPSASYARPVLVIFALALLTLVGVIATIRFGRGRSEHD